MTERFEVAKRIIEDCSTEEQIALKEYIRSLVPHQLERDWGIDADTILGAIRRSSDLTRRGVRGIIAEAVFENTVGRTLARTPWKLLEVPADLSYHSMVEKVATKVKIQIKLQRLEEGRPKLYYPKHYTEGSLYVVEVQKTRSGEVKLKTPLVGSAQVISAVTETMQKSRPYRFGDFDILAVNMHPSTADWKEFRYTLASWLLPKPAEKHLMETFQPVAAIPNDVWTNDLLTCLDWLEAGKTRQLLTEVLHVKVPKAKTKGKKQGKAKKKPAQRRLPKP